MWFKSIFATPHPQPRWLAIPAEMSDVSRWEYIKTAIFRSPLVPNGLVRAAALSRRASLGTLTVMSQTPGLPECGAIASSMSFLSEGVLSGSSSAENLTFVPTCLGISPELVYVRELSKPRSRISWKQLTQQTSRLGIRPRERFLIILWTPALTGCSRAPEVNVLGSYFPGWIIALIVAVLLTATVRLLLLRFRMEDEVGPLALFYPCLVLLFSCAMWLLCFR
jgi:hypothetical protein